MDVATLYKPYVNLLLFETLFYKSGNLLVTLG